MTRALIQPPPLGWKIGDMVDELPESPVAAPLEDEGSRLWYAVQTNPQQESAAGASLARERIDIFFPRRWVRVSHARRSGMVLRSFLPGYLFARVGHGRFEAIARAGGVRDLLRVNSAPVPIPDAIMELFMAGFDESGYRLPEPEPVGPRYRVGDAVKVIKGPFASFHGLVDRVDASGQLRILVEIFARATPVEMLASWVESLSPDRAERACRRA